MIAETVDYKKTLATLYNPPKQKFVIVDVPKMQYLMIDGRGDPNTAPAYKDAISGLYSLAYALKFTIKKQCALDYKVMPLEGLWLHIRAAEISMEALLSARDEWQWTMMIMQPDVVTPTIFKEVRKSVQAKKPDLPLSSIHLEAYDEGRAVQTLFVGPYKDESPTILKMHEFAHNEGYQLRGKHHEIYLNDPSRTAPEKLKSVLRQPIS